ncbi:unnamed protein product [Symbiodinium sp. KB8]|nr:unnamed protein product [Symbiodinium sp. KB8]
MANAGNDAPFKFTGVAPENVLPQKYLMTLNTFEKFLQMFSANAGNRELPTKIVAGRVVSNGLIHQWIRFQAPPLFIALLSVAQPVNGNSDQRFREMIKAWVEAATDEIKQKPYGEVLSDLKRVVSTCRQTIADIAVRFKYTVELFAESGAIRNGLDFSSNKISEDLSADRFNLNVTAIDTVKSPNFFNETYVVNNVEKVTGIVYSVRDSKFYNMFQDYYWKFPVRHQMMSELEIKNVSKMSVKFAKNVGYGIRTHNGDIDARPLASGEQRPPYINTFDVVLLAGKALSTDAEEPLAFAVSNMQAYIAAIHLITEYVNYNQEAGQPGHPPAYEWTDRVYDDIKDTTKGYAEKQVRLASAPQSEGGMQFPEASWNQLAVESGLTNDCKIKRKAFDVWEDELSRAPKPLALRSGDGLFPPNPSRHPEWVYSSGRVVRDARPRAQDLTQGPQHPSQDINDHPWECYYAVSAFGTSTSNSCVQTEESKASSSSDPEGTVEYVFTFTKESSATCRAKLFCSVAQPDVFPAAYDETPKFIPNEAVGATPIEHYVRRLVTYLARIQSVTQNTDYGLARKVYVKLGTQEWLKMYSRLYHGCDLHPCVNLPTPAMLTIAALIKFEDDLQDPDAEREITMPSERERLAEEEATLRRNAVQAAREMRARLSIGGNPDATTIRSQPTILCTDFELYAKNGATHFPLQNELMNKGWSQFVKFSPTISTVVNFAETQRVFGSLIDSLERTSQEQKSTVTIHIHLCLQAVIHENLAVPLHESSHQARESMEEILKDTYIKYFDKILNMVPRPPVVMINHDRRFLAASHRVLEQRQDVAGYDAVGAYLTLQLRLRGCIVVHGSSFWCKILRSLKESQSGSHVFSADKITEHEPQKHHHRGLAIYEKQLFCEKMISACFLNTQQLNVWENLLHQKIVDTKRFQEICMDFTQLHFSSTVNLNAWVSRGRRREIEEENRRDDMVRRPEVEWQNFDIALSVPEPTYTEEQHWFKIDDYKTSDLNAWASTEIFFCELCEREKDASIFAGTTRRSNPIDLNFRIGALVVPTGMPSTTRTTRSTSTRSYEPVRRMLWPAIYVQHFQDSKPGDNLLEYIKKCCPLVYMSVGKVVCSYGGLRCPIATSIAYASWGKAKQLAWDRAYDEQNNLCFIAYYDAGNAACAGFMKTLLTPQEREEFFRGCENPAEELLGDVFELSLGMLTFGLRYPHLFKNWGSKQDINACINGIERCFLLYSAKESIKLVAARQPKKRKPPSKDERVERDKEIIVLINDEERFRAVPSSAMGGLVQVVRMKMKRLTMTIRTVWRPKAKAMPRRGAHGAHAGIRIVEYDSPQVMGYAIKRRRGENDACGESIYTMGLQDNGAVCQKIEECTSHRDRKMPQRGDRRLYPFVNENDHREGYTNKSYVCISDDVYCGILDQIPDRGCHFCHPDWEGVGPCPPVVELNEHRKWYGEKAVKNIQKDLRHYIGMTEQICYRLQLLFDGNNFNTVIKRRVRLQFLGIRLGNPPQHASIADDIQPFDSRMVTLAVQRHELRLSSATRNVLDEDIMLCNGWVMPWAIRATSGQTRTPELAGMEIDPSKFAMSISNWGLFAPWDVRNEVTRMRSSVNTSLPLVVLYVPIIDIVIAGGRITESGIIVCSNPIPFRFVKEAWLCVPNDRHRYRFDLVEKILDYELEDEICTKFSASPIAKEFTPHRTIERLMELLWEMPTGPHGAAKEEFVARLGDYSGVDWRTADWRCYERLYTDAINFIIKHTKPMEQARNRRDHELRYRLCPWCLQQTPSCLSLCATCFTDLFSIGRFHRTVRQEDAPLEVPSDVINRTIEQAEIAANEDPLDEDDRQTVAEPEPDMADEVNDHAQDAPEPAPEDPEPAPESDQEDEEDNPEDVSSRIPVLIGDAGYHINQDLEHARANMQVPIYIQAKRASAVDPNLLLSRYMAFQLCSYIHKNWRANMKWLEIPLQTMRQMFQQSNRYDALGNWGPELSEVDPDKLISREVLDSEVLALGTSRRQFDDPDGTLLLRKFRTNQLVSKIMRGASQMGYEREQFIPAKHMRDDQTLDAPQMHSSCYALLQKIIGTVTGYQNFTMIRPSTSSPTPSVLCIDPCGIAMMIGHKNVAVAHLSLLIDSGIDLPSSFRARMTSSRQQAHTQRNTPALTHLPADIPELNNRIMNRPVTNEEVEEREEVRPRRPGARRQREETSGATPPPPQQARHERWQRNQRACDNRSTGSSSGYHHNRANRDGNGRWHY